MGFYDFAGSIVVHAVGGFAALAAAMVIGPRVGRFNNDPEAPHLAGHSLATASLGVFILWVGWFGFNPGSQLAFSGEANIDATMLIAVNTTLAGAAGAIAAMIVTRLHAHTHKVSLSMLLNGALAGLVGITANCDSVTNNEAIIIGLVAGILVVYGGIGRCLARPWIVRYLGWDRDRSIWWSRARRADFGFTGHPALGFYNNVPVLQSTAADGGFARHARTGAGWA
jgi:ammonia channel protein AmtB